MSPKRRSFYNTRRRRSRSLGAIVPASLSERVPKSIPEHERLETLINYVFEYTLSTLAREFSNTEDFDVTKLKEDGENSLTKIQDLCKENNLYALATDEIRSEVPLYASYLESTSCNEHIKRLEEEGSEWQEVLKCYKDDFRQIMEQKDQSDSNVNYKNENENKDYSSILNDTSSKFKGLQYEVSSLKKIKRTTTGCLQISENFIEDLNSGIEKHFLQSNDETPRTIMKKMFSTRSKRGKFDD